MSKLLFFDIDGTLVDFGATEMIASTIEALDKARANGHKAFLCTGRSYNQIYPFLLDYGFDGIVAAGGAYVEYQGKVLYHRMFGEKLMDVVVEKLARPDTAMIFQYKDGSFTKESWGQKFVDIFKNQMNIDLIQDNPAFSDITYEEDLDTMARRHSDVESVIYCNSPFEADEIQDMIGGSLRVMPASYKVPDPYSGEIIMSDINKAKGIEVVMQALGVKKEDTIGFGDGANDVEMLNFVGVGVAMGNSQQVAKDAADMVTDDLVDDGIYKAMRTLKLF